MYLINLKTMKLEYFQDDRNLIYAILSHRWGEEEVLFNDMQAGTAQSKAGYDKLKHFCDEASAANYSYAWCDTCCIDKSSSAELSESINSMFRWYQNSAVCYAYLFDVVTSTVDESSDFKNSVWFTRGWCLQELLASPSVAFYNRDWKSLGSKESLNQAISKITNIPYEALCGTSLSEFSIAQRMSWASKRVTTRVEDMAYSMLGIFGVNMPLLYGEGEGAFFRLQEEIMRKSTDQSIFAHSSSTDKQGLLATSPADFQDSSDIERAAQMITGEPYSFTNMGLSIELSLFPWSMEVYLAHLDCNKKGSSSPIAIFLMLRPQTVQYGNTKATDHAVRIKFRGSAWVNNAKIMKLPRIQKRLYIELDPSQQTQVEPRRYGYWIRQFEPINPWAKKEELWAICWNKWDSEKRIVEIPDGTYATAGIIIAQVQDAVMPVRLGFTTQFEPIIEVDGNYNLNYSNVLPDGTWHISTPKDLMFQERPPVSIKNAVLRDMSWAVEGRGKKNPGRRLVIGQHRGLPLVRGTKRHVYFAHNLKCQKLLVEGMWTWVIDIQWSCGLQDVPDNLQDLRLNRVICDGCEMVSSH